MISGDKIAPWGFTDWKRIFFSVTSEWYWFLTAYCLIYIVHPLLNKIIDFMDQKTHFILALFLFTLVGIAHKFFFIWNIHLGFVMIYFMVGYFKKYPTKIHDYILCNLIIVLTSIILLYPLVYSYHLWVDNGAYYNSPSEILVLWSSFIFVIFGLTTLNIFRNFKFKNKLISTLANASLINYVLVNNGFLVTIIVINFFNKLIFPNFGTNYILLWWLLINLGYFIVGCIVTLLYSISIGNLIKRLANWLGEKLEIIYSKFFNRFIRKENKNYSD